MRILLLGDIVGRPGRVAVTAWLESLANKPDVVVANGENAAGGFGITPEICLQLFRSGVDVITSGNHIWKQKSIIPMLQDSGSMVLRPDNYPPGNPGTGVVSFQRAGRTVQVINLQGRVFCDFTGDCPFRTAERIIDTTAADVRILDFHAEATSEKMALARFLDGRISVFAGTHTHVQTADQQVFPAGMAYLTDLGMCGSSHGVIGMETASSIGRFISGRYSRLLVSEGSLMVNGLEVVLGDDLSVEGVRRVHEHVR
jgi:2',3'-cyclic-nucleotide 2'-phosphodiesterase